MRSFKAFDLASELFFEIEALSYKGSLRDQLIRASSSVALNLTEGNAKQSVKEKKRFYGIAYASLKETEAILKLSKINDPELLDRVDHVGACIYKLMRADLTGNEKLNSKFPK